MNLSERFIYRPSQKKGVHCYDGTPCPTKEVYEAIGEVGVAEIHRVMSEMVEVRKKMFGDGKPEFYGFTDREVFFDIELTSGIELRPNAKASIEGRTGFEFPFPELLEENSYILEQTFPLGMNLGKRVFKNRMKIWLSGNLTNRLKEKQDDAIRAVKWLKEHNFKVLMKAIKE